jgi:redox-sensing transcriptional repressor
MEAFSKNQLERYPLYLKYFKELKAAGEDNVSSPKIAQKLGYSEEQVRKDLQAISTEPGLPKKGRNLQNLIDDLETFLGYKDVTSAVIVGVGHLGAALMNFPAFKEMGLEILCGFDSDPAKQGKLPNGKEVFPIEKLPNLLTRLNAHIVIITVPSSAAQAVADKAIASGAKALWNFAPIHLETPSDIVIENVNLASSLAVLSHRLNQQIAEEEK